MIRINRWIEFAHDGPLRRRVDGDRAFTGLMASLWRRDCRSDAGQNVHNLCRAACNLEFRPGQRRQTFIAVIVVE